MEHRAAGTAVISTQVLQEFVNVALRKLRLPPALIRERLDFYRRFELVAATPELMTGALDLHVLHKLSFYDALILQAAIVSDCSPKTCNMARRLAACASSIRCLIPDISRCNRSRSSAEKGVWPWCNGWPRPNRG